VVGSIEILINGLTISFMMQMFNQWLNHKFFDADFKGEGK
jgi:hypothetical protein